MSTSYRIKNSAVIIAAGYSSRMHAFKPLLPMGDKSVLETTASIFLQAGIRDIVVVIGHQGQTLIPLIQSMDLKWVLNEDYEKGMFTSIQTGIRVIDPSSQCFFMMPVDIPMVKPDTIKLILEAYDDQKMDVLYPSCEGRRGHPPLITTRLIPELLRSRGEDGLKGFLGSHAKSVSHLNVADLGILMDMDTKEDYFALLRSRD